MSIAALIPFKDLAQAKSRLALVLSEEQRRRLARQMLDHVVDVLIGVGDIDSITILSPIEPDVAAKTKWICDRGRGLNPEIAEAVPALGTKRVLVIHADLPQLTHEDIHTFIEVSGEHDVTIAPDKAGTGTNALLIEANIGFPFAFGVGSFEAHSRIASEHKWSLGIVRRSGLSLDIDDPADLTAAGLNP